MHGPALLIAIIIGFVVIAGLIVAFVFYLINLMNLLKEIDESNRQMPPSNVFLIFIPLFNLGFAFYMYQKISESIKLEAESRGFPPFGDSLKGLGLAIAIAGVIQFGCKLLQEGGDVFATISGIASLASLVLMIIYWVKAAGIKKAFKEISNPHLLD